MLHLELLCYMVICRIPKPVHMGLLQRIEVAEMKLLRPLAGHTFNDHKTHDSIHRELQTECILDKIDEYRRNWLLHLQRMMTPYTANYRLNAY